MLTNGVAVDFGQDVDNGGLRSLQGLHTVTSHTSDHERLVCISHPDRSSISDLGEIGGGSNGGCEMYVARTARDPQQLGQFATWWRHAR